MEGNKSLDLSGFTLYDSNAIQHHQNKQQLQQTILLRTVDNIKYIFRSALDTKKQEILAMQSLPQQQQIHNFNISKLYLKLSETSTVFPRSRKLPTQKAPTKWQAFAKEKGIKKRKKMGFKYDSDTKNYVARWGSKSKKNAYEPPIMQEKNGRNPFEDTKNLKKLNRQKQKLKQLKNLEKQQ